MAYDPNYPPDHVLIKAVDFRNQFSALKAICDAQQIQINALQDALSDKAFFPQVGEFDPGFHTPPTFDDMEAVRTYVTQLVQGLKHEEW